MAKTLPVLCSAELHKARFHDCITSLHCSYFASLYSVWTFLISCKCFRFNFVSSLKHHQSITSVVFFSNRSMTSVILFFFLVIYALISIIPTQLIEQFLRYNHIRCYYFLRVQCENILAPTQF